MSFSEADTRSKLIDPAIYSRGWPENHIKREESAGTIEIVAGKAKRNAKGRVDYTLRIKVATSTQPVAVAIIEAKAKGKHPGHGLEQVYGLKAVNPNAKNEEDNRTPEQLLDFIKAKGREIAEALSVLRMSGNVSA